MGGWAVIRSVDCGEVFGVMKQSVHKNYSMNWWRNRFDGPGGHIYFGRNKPIERVPVDTERMAALFKACSADRGERE